MLKKRKYICKLKTQNRNEKLLKVVKAKEYAGRCRQSKSMNVDSKEKCAEQISPLNVVHPDV